MARKKQQTFEVRKGEIVPEGTQEVLIPDEALSYIVSHFLEEKNKDGMPIVIGISQHTVEAVIQLLIDWSAANGYVRNGVLTLGGYKID